MFVSFLRLDPPVGHPDYSVQPSRTFPFPRRTGIGTNQILGTGSGGELEVLLVAVKTDIVEKQLFGAGETAGLKMRGRRRVDCAPANTFH